MFVEGLVLFQEQLCQNALFSKGICEVFGGVYTPSAGAGAGSSCLFHGKITTVIEPDVQALLYWVGVSSALTPPTVSSSFSEHLSVMLVLLSVDIRCRCLLPIANTDVLIIHVCERQRFIYVRPVKVPFQGEHLICVGNNQNVSVFACVLRFCFSWCFGMRWWVQCLTYAVVLF